MNSVSTAVTIIHDRALEHLQECQAGQLMTSFIHGIIEHDSFSVVEVFLRWSWLAWQDLYFFKSMPDTESMPDSASMLLTCEGAQEAV
eukprot:1152052-Pelagomonas_calceolata.AAC.6